MKSAVVIITFIALLAGLNQTRGEKPDWDDSKTFEKIVGEAVDASNFEQRTKEGEVLQYSADSQTPYTGWAIELHKNGLISMLSHYKAGRLDGSFIGWYEDGQKMTEGTFNGGKPVGTLTRWRENGSKLYEATYKDGKPDGPQILWHANGKTDRKWSAKNGKDDGLSTWWYASGVKKKETTFKAGKKVGFSKLWTEEGVVVPRK